MGKNAFKKISLFLTSLFILSVMLPACSSTKLPNDSVKNEQTTTQSVSTPQPTNDTTQATPSPDNGNNTGTATPTPEPVNNPGNNQKVKAKALYLTGWTVGSMKKVQHFVDLANTTEVNAYVVDIKDDDGLVGYESSIPAVQEAKAWTKKYDVDKVIKAFHDNNIHVIGRVVCFKDPYISSKNPEWAVKHKNGGLFKSKSTDGKMITWLDPYNKNSWPYLVEIAKEGIAKGFDEIQFDYIRFPNDGDRKSMDFGQQDKKRFEVINEFLAYARKEMPNVILSADVFGIICESPADTENIGQYLELIGKDIDYISPMAYPSHYALGQIVNKVKFNKPDLEPYGVVYNTLLKAKDRISKTEGYRADVRPYLQAFSAPWIGKGNYMKYGPEQVRQQIKAVYDAGYEEWILWDPNNKYDTSAFEKESK